MNFKSRILVGFGVMTTLVGGALYSAPSYAQATSSGSSLIDVGALVGVGFLNKDLGNQIDLGVDAGYKILPNIQVGGYFTYNALNNIPGSSASLFTVAAEASYILEDVGVLSGLRIGPKLGVGFVNFSSGTSATVPGATTTGTSSTSFVYGPHVAYDWPMMSSTTIGGEANYLLYTSNTGFNAFNLLASLKFWF
jgi:hypothetical protein